MSSETLLQGCQILRKKHEPWKQSFVRRGCGWAEKTQSTIVFESAMVWGPLFILFQSFSNLGAGSPTIYLEGVAELGIVLESGKGKERASEVSSCQPKTRGSKKWWIEAILQLAVFQFNIFCGRRNGPHPDIFSTVPRSFNFLEKTIKWLQLCSFSWRLFFRVAAFFLSCGFFLELRRKFQSQWIAALFSSSGWI